MYYLSVSYIDTDMSGVADDIAGRCSSYTGHTVAHCPVCTGTVRQRHSEIPVYAHDKS